MENVKKNRIIKLFIVLLCGTLLLLSFVLVKSITINLQLSSALEKYKNVLGKYSVSITILREKRNEIIYSYKLGEINKLVTDFSAFWHETGAVFFENYDQENQISRIPTEGFTSKDEISKDYFRDFIYDAISFSDGLLLARQLEYDMSNNKIVFLAAALIVSISITLLLVGILLKKSKHKLTQ